MRKVCGWCNNQLSSTEHSRSNDVTHNICSECSERVFRTSRPRTVQGFINTLSSPVIIIKDTNDIALANKHADKILKLNVGHKLGNAVECSCAQLPSGCAQTVHCKACAIRKVIQETTESGKSHNNIAVYQDTHTPTGTKHHTIKLSTEKIGATILVRIDELKEKIIDKATHIKHSPWISLSSAA